MAVEENRKPMIEQKVPLFIHPSDRPGYIVAADGFHEDDFDS